MGYVRSAYVPAHAETGYDVGKLNSTLTLLGETFNPKAEPYGAVMDGVTDDSAALRACVDDIEAAGGGVLWLPDGVLKVTASGCIFPSVGLGTWFQTTGVTCILPSNTLVTGPGVILQEGVPAEGDVAPHTGHYSVFGISGEGVSVSNITIDGITFRGENDPFTYYLNNQAAAIRVYSATEAHDIVVKNCKFQNLYGFSFQAAGVGIERIHMINCTMFECANGVNNSADHAIIQGNQFTTTEGIETAGAYVRILGNVFIDVFGALSIGGYNADPTVAHCPGFVIQGNIIKGSTGAGFVIADSIRGATVSNNTFTRCYDGAITFSYSTGMPPTEVVFSGNLIYGNTAVAGSNVYGVNLAGGGYHTFIGNHLFDEDVDADWYQQFAILVNSDGCYIAGNSIHATDRFGTGYCIVVNDNRTCQLGENYLSGVKRLNWGTGTTSEPLERVFRAVTDQVIDYRITGASTSGTVTQYTQFAGGKMEWGNGVGGVARDVSLERTAANVLGLGTNDALKTGAAVHGSLPAATGYAAGSQFYCTTDKQPLWSDGTNWVEADGTNH